MNYRQAETLVVALRAAFPRPEWDDTATKLYVTKLCTLDDAAAAKTAVNLLIDGSRFRPTIAEILAEYRPLAQRNREARSEAHGLPLPELTEELRRENLARMRELRDRIEKAAEM